MNNKGKIYKILFREQKSTDYNFIIAQSEKSIGLLKIY